MSRQRVPSVIVALLLAAEGPALAEIKIEVDCGRVTFERVPARYDTNGNGRLDTNARPRGPSELEVFALHQCQTIYAKLDQDLDGAISPAELAAYQAAAAADNRLNKTLEFVMADGREAARDAPIDVAEDRTKPAAAKPFSRVETSQGFLIRKDYHAASILSKPPKTDPASLRPEGRALLSYVKDNRADDQTLSARGAVVAFHRWSFFGDTQPLPTMTAAAVGGGIEFDRTISSSDSTKEVNALTFRLDGDVEFASLSPFSLDYFKLSPNVTTDFDFKSAQIGIRAEYSPVENILGIGVSRRIPGLADLPLEFRWQPTLRVDYQRVLDDGGQPTLIDKNDFFFIGAAIGAQIFFDFKPLERLSLDANYLGMTDLANDAGGFDYLDVSANWALDQARHFSLTANYRTGREPRTRKKVDQITIGFGVQF